MKATKSLSVPPGIAGIAETVAGGWRTIVRTFTPPEGTDRKTFRPGSFAEYTATGANTLIPKPKGISFDVACQTEPVSGAWKGVIHFSEMRVGDDVVIIGTGGIGMYCLMVAKAAGAGRLIAVDVSDHALKQPAAWERRTRSSLTRSMPNPRSTKSFRTAPILQFWKPPDRSRRST